LKKKFQDIFLIYLTLIALAKSPLTIGVEDVPENAQEEFIELITSDAAKSDFYSM